MTCDECLTQLATAPLAEIDASREIAQHRATCTHCSHVVTMLHAGYGSLATTLDSAQSAVAPPVTALTAMQLARRRGISRVISVIGTVLTIALAIAFWEREFPNGGITLSPRLHTETIQLQCLTPQQAGDLILPYVRSHGSLYYATKPPLQAITVRATRSELSRVHGLFRTFDEPVNGVCTVKSPAGLPAPPAPPAPPSPTR